MTDELEEADGIIAVCVCVPACVMSWNRLMRSLRCCHRRSLAGPLAAHRPPIGQEDRPRPPSHKKPGSPKLKAHDKKKVLGTAGAASASSCNALTTITNLLLSTRMLPGGLPRLQRSTDGVAHTPILPHLGATSSRDV